MRNDKHLAIELRKEGKSYNEIVEELSIPKSTLSSWLSNVGWSQTIKKELIRKANYITKKRLLSYVKKRKEKREQWERDIRKEATKVFPNLLKNPLFVAGINIYWGEGDSKLKNCSLRISNTDPKMINIFISFLKKILKVPQKDIRVGIILYPDLSEKKCKLFWKTLRKYHLINFTKHNLFMANIQQRDLNTAFD